MKATPLSLLQVFVAVARRGSFTAGARELGVTTSAVSQSVRALEEHLGVVLLNRTTRAVALTDAGRRLLERGAPALGEATAAMREVSAQPGETIGRIRLTVPRSALAPIIVPVVPVFRERHPRVEVDVSVDERLVDIVTEGFDAGIRLTEAIERDMVQARLTDPFRFVVVAAPAYLERHGVPARPEALLEHDCIGIRLSTGDLYAWELERGKRTLRVPVRGTVATNDSALRVALAESGLGLAYVPELDVTEAVRAGRLVRVLDAYAAQVPGYFLYYPSRAQRSPALQLFVQTAREVLRVGR